jgi:glycosyltransferase involved in cell wall biosynthesis
VRIVAFGHHNNKRPEIVIRALSFLPAELRERTQLVVLGARGPYADELRDLAMGFGVLETLHLPGFVSDSEYARIISSASAVVMASSDEGFGLPVAEAEYFGIPTVITADSGMEDIHPNAIVAREATGESVAEALVSAVMGSPTDGELEIRSWRDVAGEIRSCIAGEIS